jgi:formamidopyrimidine-DNA glycosylase
VPELPEVETIVRLLAPRLTGRKVLRTEFFAERVLRGTPEPDIEGRRILGLERYGKHILMRFDNGVLSIHLGMTGKLLLDGAETPYTRACFTLDRGILLFDDVRQFGRMEWNPGTLELLGPEPLTISPEEFRERLKLRRTSIKALLLDQKFVRGVGNIYADEALFRARIHPLAVASRLSGHRARRLRDAIAEVLLEAIENRGSSVSDYVDSEGRPGSFQAFHRVYQRENLPCLVCGALVRRVVVVQRGTHYCPRCQRR